jgi:hypothetical protein
LMALKSAELKQSQKWNLWLGIFHMEILDEAQHSTGSTPNFFTGFNTSWLLLFARLKYTQKGMNIILKAEYPFLVVGSLVISVFSQEWIWLTYYH